MKIFTLFALAPVLLLANPVRTNPALTGPASGGAAVASEAPGSAQEPRRKERDVSQYNLGKDGLAIEGFDPVAYFPEGGGSALKGLERHEHVHEGVRYRFASEENLAIFKKEPAKYEPAYGGWCAFAMASGEKVEIDPKSFHVDDDKLLLFYKSFFSDTRKKWLKEPEVLEPKADAAWAKFLAKK